MGCKTIVEQLAEATAKSDVNTSDQLPIVESSTLYNVTVGNLALALGLTGSLTGQNGNSAVPVLTGVAPDYEIRGIKGGNGISAQLNTSGSITINMNVTNAGNTSNGLPIIKNIATDPISFKRIKAGSGIDIASEANSIVISNSQLSENTTKLVSVSSIDDFPTAVAGVITLADDTEYILAADVSTSNRFVYGSNCVISGNDAFINTLTYTGIGTMFTLGSGLQGLKEIGISCANGTLLDSSASNGGGNWLMRYCLIRAVNDFGTLGTGSISLGNMFILSHTGEGFTFETESNLRFAARAITFADTTEATADIFNLGLATFDSFVMQEITFLDSTTGQNFLKGVASGANITAGNIGFVSRVTINGDMTGLDTITNRDAGWDFTDCNTIGDTFPLALTSLSATATTTISTIDTPVVVNGTFNQDIADVFTVSVAGRCTYDGVRGKTVDITATLAARPTSGTKTYTFYVAKNGTIEADSGISREIATGALGALGLVWAVDVVTDDYIEIYVENNTDAQDVEFQKLVVRVK